MLLAMLPGVPAFAVTAKEKMATCKFGADDQKLAGAARNAFMKKCMSNQNDPRGPAVGAGRRRAAAAAEAITIRAASAASICRRCARCFSRIFRSA